MSISYMTLLSFVQCVWRTMMSKKSVYSTTLLLVLASLATPGISFQLCGSISSAARPRPESQLHAAPRTQHNKQKSSKPDNISDAVTNSENTAFSAGENATPDNDDNLQHPVDEMVNGRRIPHLNLPPRLATPWQNHHQATLNFMRDRRSSTSEAAKSTEKDNAKGDNQIAGGSRDEIDRDEQQQKQKEQQQRNPVGKFFSNIVSQNPLVSATPEWKRLQQHSKYIQSSTHLKDLLQDKGRCETMYAEHDGVYLDYSRQRATLETMKLLMELAEKRDLKGQIEAMFNGEKINFTEERAVLHTALRADRSKQGTVFVDDVDAIKEVYEVLDQIKEFTDGVRSGKIRGYTGKRLRNIVSVGIGGSYLGPEFLHEVLKTEPEGVNAALGYDLRFLANVDPVDVERTCADLDPEETLIVIVSKTFTTAETMLNARTMRQWLWDFMGNDKEVVRKHVVACASESSTAKVAAFGIDTENRFFRFWDWVGGRYSVCSAAGAVPLSLLYGFDLFEKFLEGARSMDEHYLTAPMDRNIPLLMGLLGVWNMSFMGYNTRTTLPYAEALLKLPAHIQQLDMESNGKCMTKFGIPADYPVGEIDFGEPGTNGQHSFYQLLHMGQTVPCDFIGFVQSQHDLCLDDESLSSHDELMANFFAQPDALATGKTAEEVSAEGVKDDLVPHKIFEGNRPSTSLLLPKLTAYATGQILALYEHRTATQGFIWDINSFDQWGVELGKKLAIDVRTKFLKARSEQEEGETQKVDVGADNPATSRILSYYIRNSDTNRSCKESLSQRNSMTSISRKTHLEQVPPEGHDLGGKKGKLSR